MNELVRYRKKAIVPVTAVQLNLDTMGFSYDKWGGLQTCKKLDWVVENDGETYTIDQESFALTYEEVSPGRYAKVVGVWSEVAVSAGTIATKEGGTDYEAGDRLVYNAADRGDGYAMSAEKFDELYEVIDG